MILTSKWLQNPDYKIFGMLVANGCKIGDHSLGCVYMASQSRIGPRTITRGSANPA